MPQLLKILEKYPPLTSRLTLQLLFFQKMFFNKDIDLYFQSRDLKYEYRDFVQKQLKEKI